MPFSVKLVFPEWTCCWICLIFFSTVGTLKSVWTWFAFFGFEMRRVDFVIGFAAPTKFTMVLQFVGTITLYTLQALNSARKSRITPFPIVFTLRDTRVCISHSNCRNISSNIEVPIYKALGLSTTLSIPYIDPHDCHIWFGRHLNHLWFGSENNIVKDLVLLNDSFDIIWWEAILWISISIQIVWNAYNLEIELRLR